VLLVGGPEGLVWRPGLHAEALQLCLQRLQRFLVALLARPQPGSLQAGQGSTASKLPGSHQGLALLLLLLLLVLLVLLLLVLLLLLLEVVVLGLEVRQQSGAP